MNRDLSVTPAVETPTRVRYGVLGFACSLSMITYLDRVCMNNSATPMVDALNRTGLNLTGVEDLRWAFAAFALAYAAFEVPTGWLGDVFGPRTTLIRIVLWWSFFTALTGLTALSVGGVTFGLGLLIVVRFLFGVGEAGAYPNITRALHNWFPFTERGVGQGAVWMSGRLMGGLTPLLWWALVEQINLPWRATFWLFGALGVVWCVAFAYWFRNRPEEKPGVNAAEQELIRAGRLDLGAAHAHVPWLRLLTSGNLWALCLMYFCAAYGWYFSITYLSSYLEEQHGVDPKDMLGAVYKGGPLWLGAVACLGGGWLTDRFIRRTGNRKWGRRLFGLVGHTVSALCYLACPFMPNAFTFFLAISLAAFFNDLTMGSAWAACQDIGKRHAAIVAGCMNTVGNLGGAVAGWVTGSMLKMSLASYVAAHGLNEAALSTADKAAGHRVGYEISFITFGVGYAIAVVLWLFFNSTRPVIPEDAAPADTPS
jgi:ACS family glucarate transporter-like MFS transporter